jgi:hypothetical protein
MASCANALPTARDMQVESRTAVNFFMEISSEMKVE